MQKTFTIRLSEEHHSIIEKILKEDPSIKTKTGAIKKSLVEYSRNKLQKNKEFIIKINQLTGEINEG